MRFVPVYVALATPFVVLDMLWLSIMADRLYRPALRDILKPQLDLWPAAIFYVLYPLGLIVFAIVPACENGGPWRALLLGMMFGFFTYATYDLTNQATLRNWSTTITFADICWGSALGGISALIGYIVASRVWTLS
jgi:uncharacterized membrane protein